MTRRIRTAALLSAATLLVGGSLSLGLAPLAFADDAPPATPAVQGLPNLAIDPSTPQAGDQLVVSAPDGCPNISGGPLGQAAATTVTVEVTGPNGFDSKIENIAPSTNGDWSSNSGGGSILVGDDAGDYAVNASCISTTTGITVPYTSVGFTIQAATPPPTTPNPSVIANPTTVAAGSSVTVGGTGFDGATSATVSLGTIGSQTVTIASGSFSGATFTIPFDQAAGQIAGTVTSNGGINPQPFSITVTNDTSVDGPVPGGGGAGTGAPTTGAGTTGTGTTGTGTTGTGTSYVAARPGLAHTGANTLWPGVVGGLLVLSGAGLLWVGRRRADAGVAAV